MREVAFCRECSGTRVQVLKLCWVSLNDDVDEPDNDGVEVDWESEPGCFYSTTRWCPDCGAEASIDYVSVTEEESDA